MDDDGGGRETKEGKIIIIVVVVIIIIIIIIDNKPRSGTPGGLVGSSTSECASEGGWFHRV
jgi:hypothetical protein